MAEVSFLLELLIIFLLLLGSCFFSSSETGLTALSRARLHQLVREGSRRAALVTRLRKNKDQLISTILLGNNLVNIAATAVATSLAIKLFGEAGVVYVTLVLTFVILIFAEVLPKTYAIQHSEKVALLVAPILAWLMKLFKPITLSIRVLVQWIFKLFGIDITQSHSLVSASDVIRGTIEMHVEEGEIVKQERDMLGGILDLESLEVESVMIHRNHIETVDFSLPVNQIIKLVIQSVHSRIPFWEEDQDNIIGLLHVKTLIKLMNEHSGKLTHKMIREAMIEPWFIPETTTLREQLLAFRHHKQHFAIVVDEYGALQGIVTLEDIIEEIVGEISDEHDRENIQIVECKDGSYEVEGTLSIRDLNRALDWNLPVDEVATIAGLVIHEARSIPEVGASFVFFGYQFTVLEKKVNQITSVSVRHVEENLDQEDNEQAS